MATISERQLLKTGQHDTWKGENVESAPFSKSQKSEDAAAVQMPWNCCNQLKPKSLRMPGGFLLFTSFGVGLGAGRQNIFCVFHGDQMWKVRARSRKATFHASYAVVDVGSTST